MSSAARISAARSLPFKKWATSPINYHHRSVSFLTTCANNSCGYDSYKNCGVLRSSFLGVGGASIIVAASSSLSSSPTSQCESKLKATGNIPLGAPFPFQPTFNKEVQGPKGIPSRAEQVRRLQSCTPSDPYDVLVIGGGATGVGIAFDAATRSPALKVACVERGDFASETSSRSTKLIWAGIKYLASASASLISQNLLTSPVKTLKDFYGEFKMVFQCHQERMYMLEKQKHLTNWVRRKTNKFFSNWVQPFTYVHLFTIFLQVPIVCPFTEWHIWPPPFGHWLFSFFPLLAPAVFKFYDGLSQFSCPSSFIMGKKRAREMFPQLNEREVKYCAVFYEGQHNDARTNLAIAMTAAEKGAHIANYVEMLESIFNEEGKVIGCKVLDRIRGETFESYAKNIFFAGGPFTDALREKEIDVSKNAVEQLTPAVQGASGSHIVLPGYYAPNNMGLLDYNTSDGRFLFFLPWQGSVIVGTTDKKCSAETLPYPPEDEIQWMLKECEKYLSQ